MKVEDEILYKCCDLASKMICEYRDRKCGYKEISNEDNVSVYDVGRTMRTVGYNHTIRGKEMLFNPIDNFAFLRKYVE